jgi:hypothetical protein
MTKKNEAIAGFFRRRAEGEAAQQELFSNGFTRDEVSFLSGDTRGHETPAVGPLEQLGGDVKGAHDAWVGGVVGLAAGMVAMAIPGIGPFIAAGPLAVVIGGVGVGAAAGGLVGVLREHGLSDDEAKFYAEGVERGGALITVHDVGDERAESARKILEKCGALDTESLTKEIG